MNAKKPAKEPKVSVALKIDKESLDRLDDLAAATGRTRSDLLYEAAVNYWNLGEYEPETSPVELLRQEMEERMAALEKKLLRTG